MKKKSCHLYYPVNWFSLILMLTNLKNRDFHNILYLNVNHFDNETINFFRNYLLVKFDELKIINHKRKRLYSGKTQLENFITRTVEIKKFKNRLKTDFNHYNVKKIYFGADDFNFAVYRSINKIVPTIFVEHGWGNIIHAISSKSKITLRRKFAYPIYKFLYFSRIIDCYPFKYLGFQSVLCSRLRYEIRINNFKINPIKINNITKIKKKIFEMNKYIQNKKKINIKKKKFIFLNTYNIQNSKNSEDTNDLINKIITMKKHKNEFFFIKPHPNQKYDLSSFNHKLINEFKRKKINYIFLKKNSFLSKLPAELIIHMFDIKKVISDVSSIPFFVKIIFKKIECNVFYNYTFRNPSLKWGKQHTWLKNVEDMFKRSFKDINFY